MKIQWCKELAYNYLRESWNRRQGFQALISSKQDLSDPLFLNNELFSSCVILDLLGKFALDHTIKSGLIHHLKRHYGEDNLFSFYENRALLSPDIDDTSLGVSLLSEHSAIENWRALDSVNRVVANRSPKGVLAVFFPPCLRTGRIDIVACANALYLLYLYGKEEEAQTTENLLYTLLEEKDDGISLLSPYYFSPDAFLYALARLVSRFPRFRKKFEAMLKKKLQSRIGTTEQLLDLAMRVIVAKSVGVSNLIEAKKLAESQTKEGSWLPSSFFTDGMDRDGKQKHYYGSKEISTAFCIRALEGIL